MCSEGSSAATTNILDDFRHVDGLAKDFWSHGRVVFEQGDDFGDDEDGEEGFQLLTCEGAHEPRI